MIARRALLAAALALACAKTPATTLTGDFSGPVGLAITTVADRDLLFIASSGTDELRALNICNTPAGQNPACDRVNHGFVPGPIRLFPGSVLVGKRPARLAGVRLQEPGGKPHGVVLVAGAEANLRIVDAQDVLDASNKLKSYQPLDPVPLPAIAIDVVAPEAPAPAVKAIAISEATPAAGSAITVFSVTLGPGNKPVATPVQGCAVNFVPTRLALVPGNDDFQADGSGPQHVFVADGTPDGTAGGVGDGAVEVSVPDIPVYVPGGNPPLCPVTRRLPASDPSESPRLPRPLNSLALSPRYAHDASTVKPGGLFMLGATLGNGALCSEAGAFNCGAGRIVLLRPNIAPTGQPPQASTIVPAPPTDIFSTDASPARMAPLRPGGAAREVAFMGRALCPPPTDPTDPDTPP